MKMGGGELELCHRGYAIIVSQIKSLDGIPNGRYKGRDARKAVPAIGVPKVRLSTL